MRHALGTEGSAAAVGYVRNFLASEPAFGTPLGIEALRHAPREDAGPIFSSGEPAAASPPDATTDEILE